MEMQSQAQKPRGRLPELSPFAPQEATPPPVATLARGRHEPRSHEPQEADGELAYGCVEWFRYPRTSRHGQSSGRP